MIWRLRMVWHAMLGERQCGNCHRWYADGAPEMNTVLLSADLTEHFYVGVCAFCAEGLDRFMRKHAAA